MKHKILWSLIGIMAVAALVLASCAGDGGNGGNGGNGEDEPQYGGKQTYRTLAGGFQSGFDPLVWNDNAWLQCIFDQYFTVPWEKGPAGTGEYSYRTAWYPRSMYVGEYLESFEVVDLYQVNYKLRQGIHYWDKAPVNGREMTVDDIMWNWLRDCFHDRAGTYLRADPAAGVTFWTDYLQEIEDGVQPEQPLLDHLAFLREVTPQLETYYPGLEDMMRSEFAGSYSLVSGAGYDVSPGIALMTYCLHKIDDYNFELRVCRCAREAWSYINGIWPTPREVTEVDEFADPETVVGTGPWMPVEFDMSSIALFERNPDYWKYDPAHPENQLPYTDEFEVILIEDESAYYAALESAQLDSGSVEWYKVQYFQDNYPEMVYYPGVNGWTHCIFLRNDIPPFNDIKVRHAAMLAIDQQAIMDHYQGSAVLYCWPEQEWATPVFTPFNQLPAETQELFGYDPDRARELLVEAGYPTGFSTEMTVYPSSEDRESCMIVQDYLADVGINVEMLTPDGATYSGVLYGRNYEHMISCWWGNDFPGDAMMWAEGGSLNSPYNFGRVDDPIAYEVGLSLGCMLDDNTYYATIKADNVRRLGMMYQLLIPTPVGAGFEWPWHKGTYGASDLGWPNETASCELAKYTWIDQDLKDDMGY